MPLATAIRRAALARKSLRYLGASPVPAGLIEFDPKRLSINTDVTEIGSSSKAGLSSGGSTTWEPAQNLLTTQAPSPLWRLYTDVLPNSPGLKFFATSESNLNIDGEAGPALMQRGVIGATAAGVAGQAAGSNTAKIRAAPLAICQWFGNWIGGSATAVFDPVTNDLPTVLTITDASHFNRSTNILHEVKHVENTGAAQTSGGYQHARFDRGAWELANAYGYGVVHNPSVALRYLRTNAPAYDAPSQAIDRSPPSMLWNDDGLAVHHNGVGRVFQSREDGYRVAAYQGLIPYIGCNRHRFREDTALTAGGLVGQIPHATFTNLSGAELTGARFELIDPGSPGRPRFYASIEDLGSGSKLTIRNAVGFLSQNYYPVIIRVIKNGMYEDRPQELFVSLKDTGGYRARLNSQGLTFEGLRGLTNSYSALSFMFGFRVVSQGSTFSILETAGGQISLRVSNNQNRPIVTLRNGSGTVLYQATDDESTVTTGVDGWAWGSFDWSGGSGVFKQGYEGNTRSIFGVTTGSAPSTFVPIPSTATTTMKIGYSDQSATFPHGLLDSASNPLVGSIDMLGLAVWPGYIDFSNSTNRNTVRNNTTKASSLVSVSGVVGGISPILWMEAEDFFTGFDRANPTKAPFTVTTRAPMERV